MLYLVNIEYVEPGPAYPFQAVARMVEQSIVPSLHAIAKLEKEGKVRAGGVFAGTKSSALVVEASDNNELSRTLQGLPFWSFMRVRITPLQSFADRAAQEGEAVRFLQGAVKQGANPW